MNSDSVLGVVINWKRPGNLPAILQAMREQTVKMHVVILECGIGPEFKLPASTLAMADTVISISTNTGPIARFLAPLAFPQFKYTYFGVDDYIPGPKHVEWMLNTAKRLNDEFATIGMDGRLIRDGRLLGGKGRMHDVHPTPIDVVTSSELALTRWLPHVAQYRAELLTGIGNDVSIFEDDLFLCMGAQMIASKEFGRPIPSYLTPAPPTGDETWRARKLSAPHALCGRPDHHDVRNHFIYRYQQQHGWNSKSEEIERNG